MDTKGNRGTWTMIYDEGFEVVIAGLRFFAFNKYVPKSPESLTKDAIEDYISICDETLVGWFHKQDGTHWGCYHGKKTANTSKPMRFSRVDGGNSQELTKVLAPDAMSLAPMKAPSVSGSRISARFDDDDLEKLDHDPVYVLSRCPVSSALRMGVLSILVGLALVTLCAPACCATVLTFVVDPLGLSAAGSPIIRLWRPGTATRARLGEPPCTATSLATV